MWGFGRSSESAGKHAPRLHRDDKPPPLPGPSPAARAALEAAATRTCYQRPSPEAQPPPLPGPSPAARLLAGKANAQIVVTGEESGVKIGVLRLHEQPQQMPEFCCKCGLRDAGGRWEDGAMYCGKCWSLVEDMAALRVSAGLHELQRRDLHTWEDRCEDCGERDPNGAVDERDGNFYCSACWSVADADQKPTIDTGAMRHPRDGESVMSVCHECGQVGLGEVDESDCNFYCNGCWAAIGLGRATPEIESATPDTAVTGTGGSRLQGALPSPDQFQAPAARKNSSTLERERKAQPAHKGEEKPPPLPGPSPAARAAAVYGGLAPLNIQPSLLNEHYIAGPLGHNGWCDRCDRCPVSSLCQGQEPAAQEQGTAQRAAEHAVCADTAMQQRPARLPVRQHLKERAERIAAGEEGDSVAPAGQPERLELLQSEAGFERNAGQLSQREKRAEEGLWGGKVVCTSDVAGLGDKLAHMTERERERAQAKQRHKEERERKKEWKVRIAWLG